MVVDLDVNEIFKFVTAWNSTSISIYYLIIVGLVFFSIFVFHFNGNCCTSKIGGKGIAFHTQGKANLFYQFIGSFAILVTCVGVSIHSTTNCLRLIKNLLFFINIFYGLTHVLVIFFFFLF